MAKAKSKGFVLELSQKEAQFLIDLLFHRTDESDGEEGWRISKALNDAGVCADADSLLQPTEKK